jgi:hypothetical protein
MLELGRGTGTGAEAEREGYWGVCVEESVHPEVILFKALRDS